MKKSLKKAWIRDLRSDEYEQGRSWLCYKRPEAKKAQYCCLGVLADIAIDGYWEHDHIGDFEFWSIGGRSSVLGDDDLQAMGLNSRIAGKLIGLNDSGNSFAEIADWIEENIKDE